MAATANKQKHLSSYQTALITCIFHTFCLPVTQQRHFVLGGFFFFFCGMFFFPGIHFFSQLCKQAGVWESCSRMPVFPVTWTSCCKFEGCDLWAIIDCCFWQCGHPISAGGKRDEDDCTSCLQRGLMTGETLGCSGSITVLNINECKCCIYVTVTLYSICYNIKHLKAWAAHIKWVVISISPLASSPPSFSLILARPLWVTNFIIPLKLILRLPKSSPLSFYSSSVPP